MNKKGLCALLAAFTTAFAASGCQGMFGASEPPQATEPAVQFVSTRDEALMPLEGLTAAPAGSFTPDVGNSRRFTADGVIYKNAEGLYGVMSPDGVNDTYAQFTEVLETGKGYTLVFSGGVEDVLNNCGLLNSNAEEILEPQFAYVEILSDRYARVFTIEGTVTDKNKTVLAIKDNTHFYTYPMEGATWFAGSWQIFDLQKREFVPDLSVSNSFNDYVYVTGQYIHYKNDAQEKIVIDASGSKVTDDRRILENGSYLLDEGGKTAVYSTDSERLFIFSEDDYTINSYSDWYYVGRKGDSFFLLNEKGEPASPEFPTYLSRVYRDYVITGDGDLFTVTGKKIAGGNGDLIFDEVNRDAYCYAGKDEYLVLDVNGNVLMRQKTNAPDKEADEENFLFCQKNRDLKRRSYYHYGANAYTLSAVRTADDGFAAPWLVTTEVQEHTNLIEVRTGATLLQGCVSCQAVVSGGKEYIYAFNGEDYTVYTVQTASNTPTEVIE